jgi:hypothetical protein
MNFPTMVEVEAADRMQLCKWHRFLPSAETPETQAVQQRIYERWVEAGGFTPEISKAIGWERR